jgi:hypothetical protein
MEGTEECGLCYGVGKLSGGKTVVEFFSDGSEDGGEFFQSDAAGFGIGGVGELLEEA